MEEIMKLSIASYSFHRTLAAGNHDMFKYITDCKELGATQLEPWNGHLTPLKDAIEIWKAGADPDDIRFRPGGSDGDRREERGIHP